MTVIDTDEKSGTRSQFIELDAVKVFDKQNIANLSLAEAYLYNHS